MWNRTACACHLSNSISCGSSVKILIRVHLFDDDCFPCSKRFAIIQRGARARAPARLQASSRNESRRTRRKRTRTSRANRRLAASREPKKKIVRQTTNHAPSSRNFFRRSMSARRDAAVCAASADFFRAITQESLFSVSLFMFFTYGNARRRRRRRRRSSCALSRTM